MNPNNFNKDSVSYLDHTKPEHYFVLKDGRIVKNLLELHHSLKEMDEHMFNHHVTFDRNDFAAWIFHAVGDKVLANDLGHVKDINETVKILETRILELGFKTNILPDKDYDLFKSGIITNETLDSESSIVLPYDVPDESIMLYDEEIDTPIALTAAEQVLEELPKNKDIPQEEKNDKNDFAAEEPELDMDLLEPEFPDDDNIGNENVSGNDVLTNAPEEAEENIDLKTDTELPSDRQEQTNTEPELSTDAGIEPELPSEFGLEPELPSDAGLEPEVLEEISPEEVKSDSEVVETVGEQDIKSAEQTSQETGQATPSDIGSVPESSDEVSVPNKEIGLQEISVGSNSEPLENISENTLSASAEPQQQAPEESLEAEIPVDLPEMEDIKPDSQPEEKIKDSFSPNELSEAPLEIPESVPENSSVKSIEEPAKIQADAPVINPFIKKPAVFPTAQNIPGNNSVNDKAEEKTGRPGEDTKTRAQRIMDKIRKKKQVEEKSIDLVNMSTQEILKNLNIIGDSTENLAIQEIRKSRISKFQKRVKTGVPGFDELLAEGIPQGTRILVSGGPGSGKTTFSIQQLGYAAENGEKCLFMSFEESEERLIDHMETYGLRPREYIKSGNLLIKRFDPVKVSRVVEALLADSRGELQIDINEILDIIPKEFKPDRIVLDSLSSVASAFSESQTAYRIYVNKLFDMFEEMKTTAFIISEAQDIEKMSHGSTEEFLADGVILFYNLQKGNIKQNALEVLKMRSVNHKKKIVPFEFVQGKGIEVYPMEEIYGLEK